MGFESGGLGIFLGFGGFLVALSRVLQGCMGLYGAERVYEALTRAFRRIGMGSMRI